jgi:hypothetical protein
MRRHRLRWRRVGADTLRSQTEVLRPFPPVRRVARAQTAVAPWCGMEPTLAVVDDLQAAETIAGRTGAVDLTALVRLENDEDGEENPPQRVPAAVRR